MHAATRTGLEEAIASGFGVTERERESEGGRRKARVENTQRWEGYFCYFIRDFEFL